MKELVISLMILVGGNKIKTKNITIYESCYTWYQKNVEMTEKKHRIEDALEAVKAAQDEGVVPGGGTALLRACQKMVLATEDGHHEQINGAVIVKNACYAPIRQMAENAGLSPDIIVQEVLGSSSNMGWNFRSNQLTDLTNDGVIDPVKVTRTALQNAASCAGTLITTN